MTRLSLTAFACASVLVLSGFAAQAGEGGGGGGDDRWAQPPIFNPGPRPAPNARPYAESTLPDGTRIRSTGLGLGNRKVTTTTPDGKRVSGNRPKGADKKKNANRTVYNPKTGITSTYTNNPDGTRTGVHVDRQGNRATSTSRPAPAP
jgi:hypothetical protein